MKTFHTLHHVLRSRALLGLVTGAMFAAFVAGVTTARNLTGTAAALSLVRTAPHADAHDELPLNEHSIGRDVYSIRGTPLGRLTAIVSGRNAGESYALIATYDQEASVAGEIAVPVSRLDMDDGRLVLSTGSSDAPKTPDEAPRWLI